MLSALYTGVKWRTESTHDLPVIQDANGITGKRK